MIVPKDYVAQNIKCMPVINMKYNALLCFIQTPCFYDTVLFGLSF